jgi:hypothetical protein
MNPYSKHSIPCRSRLHHVCISLLAALALSGCLGEETRLSPPASKEVLLSLRLPGISSPAATRALTEANENHVAEVDVLVFDHSDGTFLYSAPAFEAPNETPEEDGATYTFSVRLLPTTDKIDLWVITNARSQVASCAAIMPGATKAAVSSSLVATEEGGATQISSTVAAPVPIPMWGAINSRTVSEDEGLGADSHVDLTRMVARIDVTVGEEARADFTLEEVRFYNRSTSGQIVPSETAFSGNYVSVPSLPATLSVAETPQVCAELTTPGIALEGVLYAFEAEKGNGYGAGTAEEYAGEPCLILQGTYAGHTQCYYRVDFAETQDGDGNILPAPVYLHLLRNYWYEVMIQQVKGPGFPTPEEALRSRPANLTTHVTGWTEEVKEVVLDGEYVLSVDCDSVRFGVAGGTKKFHIYTDAPGGWTVTTPLPDWLTTSAGPLSGSPGETEVSLTAVGSEPGGRSFALTVTAGRLSKTIHLWQIGVIKAPD